MTTSINMCKASVRRNVFTSQNQIGLLNKRVFRNKPQAKQEFSTYKYISSNYWRKMNYLINDVRTSDLAI